MKPEYLIVDDDPDLCWALKHLLASNGHSCQTARTARTALKLMKTHRFRLAFLDLTLPDMNGLELIARMSKLDPALRFVIISGYLSNETIAMARVQAGGLIRAFINKPFLHEEILALIQNQPPPPRAQ
jgi:DNA-binding NtrC family response regulator